MSVSRSTIDRARALVAVQDAHDQAQRVLAAAPRNAANRQLLQDAFNQAVLDLAQEQVRQAQEMVSQIGAPRPISTTEDRTPVQDSLVKRTGLKFDFPKYNLRSKCPSSCTLQPLTTGLPRSWLGGEFIAKTTLTPSLTAVRRSARSLSLA